MSFGAIRRGSYGFFARDILSEGVLVGGARQPVTVANFLATGRAVENEMLATIAAAPP